MAVRKVPRIKKRYPSSDDEGAIKVFFCDDCFEIPVSMAVAILSCCGEMDAEDLECSSEQSIANLERVAQGTGFATDNDAATESMMIAMDLMTVISNEKLKGRLCRDSDDGIIELVDLLTFRYRGRATPIKLQ